MAPLDESRRLERLQERQREWEEAWDRLTSERRERAILKKGPENQLPLIIVTEYEFVCAAHDEHGNTHEQSRATYFEESYQVICRQILNILPRKNFLRTHTFSNGVGAENEKLATGFDNTEDEYQYPSEEVFENFDSSEIYVPTATIDTNYEPHSRLGHSNDTTSDSNSANGVDSSEGDGEKSGSKSTHNSSSTISSTFGTSLDTVDHDRTFVDISQAVGIKHADNTGRANSKILEASRSSE